MIILDNFLKWESEIPDSVFLRQPEGEKWHDYTWSESGIEARKVFHALSKTGVRKGDKVAILSANCAGWIICDLAIMMGGMVSVPLYANVNADSMVHILDEAGCKFMFVGKLADQDWMNLKDKIPANVQLCSLDGFEKAGIRTWNEFTSGAEPVDPDPASPDDLHTIIYTSGTTGTPKGVMHTNQTIMDALLTAADEVRLNKKGNRFLSYLPLSHAAERGLVETGCLYSGGSISFVESKETFSSNIRDTSPTHFFGVPRIWENFQEKILDSFSQKKLDILLGIPFVKGFIKKKITFALGLDKAEVILSGAAPIAPEILSWFLRLGIRIREAYGLSEDFNVISMNPEDDIRIGTVGRIFPGQEVAIDKNTGEILQKCSWLMKGYFRRPELTEKAIVNGYLRTGDIGSMSDDGFLKVSGRVKDIFKTSKGEYIAPLALELPFRELSSVIQACVVGTTYSQPFILVVLSDIGKSMEQKEIEAELIRTLKKANDGQSKYHCLKKVIIMKNEWTISDDLLTPTLKMRRNAISKRFEPLMKDLFDSPSLVSWEE